MAKNLNLAHTVCYLMSLSVSHLDGVWNEITAKMTELGLAESRRSLRKLPDIDWAESPSGSTGGVVEWIRDLSAASEQDQKDMLVMLQALLSERFANARYKPKVPRVEE